MEQQKHTQQLGPLLCWAVVFADIGTSIYYVPGILYTTVGKLAGFFVFLTMSVFLLLTFKYVEVTYRFPQGGGVVTVASQALNRWFGALGGMFILVDYFLTAAISSLSGILYVSVVFPVLGTGTSIFGFSLTLWLTLLVLVLLGILNWVGISESARVSMVGACVAFVSDLAILVTVFTHISLQQFLSLFPEMLSGRAITPTSILIGYAGSFLAFSGLESISQLAPNMKLPRRAVGKIALFLVVLTVGLTSPLLTMLSTLLLPNDAANAERSAQIISLLAGHWGGPILQAEVAVSAGALLIFASNTAIIGSYHVFLALSRMEFFPEALLQRNKLRDTPHYAIALATGIPMVVLLLVHGNINILGDMYAFGLLGAFTLTCLGMDIVRYRQNKAYRLKKLLEKQSAVVGVDGQSQAQLEAHQGDQLEVSVDGQVESRHAVEEQAGPAEVPESPSRWASSPINFWLGILTTVLVMIAWCTNLIAKPLATAFGGSVAVVGMLIAFASYLYHRRRGRVSVVTTGVTKHVPGTVLAILSSNDPNNEKVMQAAINNKEHRPVVFLYLGQGETESQEIFRMTEPHINDVQAKDILGRANHLALEKHIECYFLYRQYAPDTVQSVWRTLHPGEIILEQRQRNLLENLSLVPESEEDDVLRLRKAHHVTAL